MLLGLHLLLIQRQGMSVPPGVEAREKAGETVAQEPFYPNYVLRDVMWWYVALAVLAALALFLPWELGIKADAFAAVPAGIRPEWYFLAMFQTLKLIPAHVLGIEGERSACRNRPGRRAAQSCCCFDLGRAPGAQRLITAAGILAVIDLIVLHHLRVCRRIDA